MVRSRSSLSSLPTTHVRGQLWEEDEDQRLSLALTLLMLNAFLYKSLKSLFLKISSGIGVGTQRPFYQWPKGNRIMRLAATKHTGVTYTDNCLSLLHRHSEPPL